MQGIVPSLQVKQTVSDTEGNTENMLQQVGRHSDSGRQMCAYPISWRESCKTLNGAPSPMISDFNHGTRPTTNPVN